MSKIMEEMMDKLETLEHTTNIESDKSSVNLESNKWIIGTITISIIILAVIYFGGIDPGAMSNALNSSSNQMVELINTQNNTEAHHFKTLVEGQKDMSNSILTEVINQSKIIGEKLNVIINNLMKTTSKADLNDLLIGNDSNADSSNGGWK